MINDNIYESAEKAIQDTLIDIKAFGINSSPRNRATKEIIGHKFTITNPRHRLISFKDRQQNIFFAIGNVLWILQQSNELEHIVYYNPRGSMFSDDGKILRGGYGKRIFDIDGVNQWYQAIRELKIDPDSRRAIISIHLPQHDWHGSLDTPCTSDMQFFIRNNKLHMINHMRSQSAAMVMPYDLFLMTMLQELMACELGVELGMYFQFSNSFHYYLIEDKMIDLIISAEDYGASMPAMPKETTYNSIKPVLEFERYARKMSLQGTAYLGELLKALKKYNFEEYWNEICYILIARAIRDNGNSIEYKEFTDKYLKNTVYGKFF
jgi:thymidylate synthase